MPDPHHLLVALVFQLVSVFGSVNRMEPPICMASLVCIGPLIMSPAANWISVHGSGLYELRPGLEPQA